MDFCHPNVLNCVNDLYFWLSDFQIEKVLQQGEISDCADPYLTLRDCDAKVTYHNNIIMLPKVLLKKKKCCELFFFSFCLLISSLLMLVLCLIFSLKFKVMKSGINLFQNKDKLEKLRGQAEAFCQRLGRYRMPFAWATVNIMEVVSTAIDREVSDSDSIKGSACLRVFV